MKEANFKETEIGKIPVDWEVRTLGEFCSTFSGGTPDSKNLNYYNGDINWISSGELNQRIITKTNGFVSQMGIDNSASKIVDKNTFLLAMYGATAGISAITKISGAINQAVLAIVNDRKVSNNYFLLNFFELKKDWIIDTYTQGGQPNLNADIVKKISIPLPPLSEQEKIAEVLSDTDLWIESTEALLAKKRQIKKGAMQKLLSPKEDWEVAELKDVAWFQEGPGLRNWQFTDSGMKVINVTNLENGYLNLSRTKRYISLQEFDRMYKHFEIQENDIVVASSGNSYGKIAVVREKDLPLVMNTSVIRFKPLEKIDYNFLLVFLKSVSFKDQIDLLTTGGAQPNFGPAHLNKILVNLPPKNEQKNIADVILSMDLEIESLENRLQKARQLKQGMMQDLLTGKVRLG